MNYQQNTGRLLNWLLPNDYRKQKSPELLIGRWEQSEVA